MYLRIISFLCLAALAPAAPALGPHALLEEAVEQWLGERDHWAFTQRAVEWEDDRPRERLERYDPSLPPERRWTLLAIDGKPPTAEQREAWARKKFKKNKRRFDAPIGDYFDFRRARVVEDTPRLVRFEVPLRRDKNWLFPTDKVEVRVSVIKETRALEHLTANVREPFKVLLGLARINDGALDLSFLNFNDEAASGPETARPTGSAHVSVSKFGERAEFTWSEFQRVTPYQVAMGRTGARQ